MTPLITTNLDQLHKALGLYVRASGKTFEEVISAKMGTGKGCLGTTLRDEFKTLAPEKGSIRSGNLSRLKGHGGGLRVRDSVKIASLEGLKLATDVATRRQFYGKWKTKRWADEASITFHGKRMNLQQYRVARELGARERSRLFVSVSANQKTKGPVKGSVDSVNYRGVKLAETNIKNSAAGPEGAMTIGGFNTTASKAVEGIMRTRGQAAAQRAVNRMVEDMIPYIARKLDINAELVGLRV